MTSSVRTAMGLIALGIAGFVGLGDAGSTIYTYQCSRFFLGNHEVACSVEEQNLMFLEQARRGELDPRITDFFNDQAWLPVFDSTMPPQSSSQFVGETAYGVNYEVPFGSYQG